MPSTTTANCRTSTRSSSGYSGRSRLQPQHRSAKFDHQRAHAPHTDRDGLCRRRLSPGGDWLACRPGCSQCCIGVFPIRWQDADRLRDGLLELQTTDPDRAARVRARTEAALGRLDPWFPGDLATGVLGESYEEAILFEEFANDEPCPVLDLDHGTCDLYAARPVLCRTFGPPMRTEEGDLATCELCFIGADTAEIARCELDPAIPALEAASNAAYDTATGRRGETLIAYALRGV